jgi:hypothetical protein
MGDQVPGLLRLRRRRRLFLRGSCTDNDLQAFWFDVLGALTIGDAVPADSPLRSMMPAAG